MPKHLRGLFLVVRDEAKYNFPNQWRQIVKGIFNECPRDEYAEQFLWRALLAL